MKKWQWLTLAALLMVIVLGSYTLEVFPDPYYHEIKVSFAEWVRRELDELQHGER